MKRVEQGRIGRLSELEPHNLAALESLQALVDNFDKDWDKFYRQAVEFHVRNATFWANEQFGKNLIEQIDPHFGLRDSVIVHGQQSRVSVD